MIIHLPLAILVAAVAGGLWGFIPGLLKAKRGVHEVIITIMLNYIALYSANAIIRSYLADGKDKTEQISPTASLASEWLLGLTDFSRLHYGFLFALFSAIVTWLIVERWRLG